jgi:hypothetical protein
MPGFLVHLGAQVMCVHGGQATPTAPDPRITVMGQPVATIAAPYVVAGCPFPTAAGGPCVTGQWVVGSTRVVASGVPLVLQAGQAVCAPTGVPLLVLVAQTRVTGI